MKDYGKLVNQIRELKRMQEELQAEIDHLQDEIKADMTAAGTDEIRGTEFKITWKTCTRQDIDKKALKAELPDVAARFIKVIEYKRFTIA